MSGIFFVFEIAKQVGKSAYCLFSGRSGYFLFSILVFELVPFLPLMLHVAHSRGGRC